MPIFQLAPDPAALSWPDGVIVLKHLESGANRYAPATPESLTHCEGLGFAGPEIAPSEFDRFLKAAHAGGWIVAFWL